MDRTGEVNYIENEASYISSAMPTEVNPGDAREVVEWWMSEDGWQEPEWWNDGDTKILIEKVAENLKSGEDPKIHP